MCDSHEEPGPVPVPYSLLMQCRPEITYYKITGCESGKGLSDLLVQLRGVLKGLHPRRVSTQTGSFITEEKEPGLTKNAKKRNNGTDPSI